MKIDKKSCTVTWIILLHQYISGPGSPGEGLNRAVVNPSVLLGDVSDGDTAVHGCGLQELDPGLVGLGNGQLVLRVVHGYGDLIESDQFGPGDHGEAPFPRTHTHSRTIPSFTVVTPSVCCTETGQVGGHIFKHVHSVIFIKFYLVSSSGM